jgi:hypothetical protein
MRPLELAPKPRLRRFTERTLSSERRGAAFFLSTLCSFTGGAGGANPVVLPSLISASGNARRERARAAADKAASNSRRVVMLIVYSLQCSAPGSIHVEPALCELHERAESARLFLFRYLKLSSIARHRPIWYVARVAALRNLCERIVTSSFE